jgi:tRNA A-37 threonylcarbamoyl transferase component Bud32
MGTMNLTPSPLAPVAPPHLLDASRARPLPLTADVPPLETVIDGIPWVHQPDCEPLLRSIPAAAWAAPAAQGWQAVKRNSGRSVWRAELPDGVIYIKYTYCDSLARRLRGLFLAPACQAEFEGGLFALRHGIATVPPIAYTHGVRCDGRPCGVLVTAAVEPARPLADFWLDVRGDDDVQRRLGDLHELTEMLAEMIARAHQAGFEHLDMHANNILVHTIAPGRYRTVFVDLQSARRGRPIDDRAVVRNLAQLNQWFRRHSTAAERLRFLRAYLRWRNEYELLFADGRALELSFAELVTALMRTADRHARRLGAQRDRRLARDGRYFCKLRLPGGWRGMAVARCKHATAESLASRLTFDRSWWQRVLHDPEHYFADDPADVCKDSHSARVRRAVLDHPDGRLFVIMKRPRARNWRRRIVQMLPPSRSLRGWRMGHGLLHRAQPTARPLAVLERRLGPLVLDNLLVTELIPGATDLESYLTAQHASCSPREWFRLKRELGHLVAGQLRQLQETGIEHRDCKASNILIVPQPRLKSLWIDMDGLRYLRPMRRRQRVRPLVRLHISVANLAGLTRTDRVRFLREYLAGYGKSPDEWRRVWSKLVAETQRKTQAKAARRAWKLKHYGRA